MFNVRKFIYTEWKCVCKWARITLNANENFLIMHTSQCQIYIYRTDTYDRKIVRIITSEKSNKKESYIASNNKSGWPFFSILNKNSSSVYLVCIYIYTVQNYIKRHCKMFSKDNVYKIIFWSPYIEIQIFFYNCNGALNVLCFLCLGGATGGLSGVSNRLVISHFLARPEW